jgi:serine protease Do
MSRIASRRSTLLFVLMSCLVAAPAFGQSTKSVSITASPEVEAVLSARAPKDANDLRLIQTQLQRVIKQVLPATVSVEVRGAAGSGVIVNKEGLVLTAAHVVSQSGRRAWVELPDGRRLAARSLGANHDVDAGMIKIDLPPKDLPFTPIYEGPDLQPGQWVVTIGQPGGKVADRAPPVRFGRVLFRGDGILCTDCKLVGGDSGGPLFNMSGEVVGIHSSIGPMLTHNFHVPISAYRDDWDRLVKGEVWGGRFNDENRALLGVRGRAENGQCLISQVFPGMPAEKAGVKAGDVVVSVDGRGITTFDELSRIISHKEPGDKLRLKVERDGDTIELTAELAGVD